MNKSKAKKLAEILRKEIDHDLSVLKAYQNRLKRDRAKRRKAIIKLAEQLMTEHGLTGWSVRSMSAQEVREAWSSWRPSEITVGRCSDGDKLITLDARYLLNLSDSAVKDIILHEIAHALHAEQTNFRPPESIYEVHGKDWRTIAKRLGVDVSGYSVAEIRRREKRNDEEWGRIVEAREAKAYERMRRRFRRLYK